MQLVHTRMLLGAPLTIAFTFCRFTFQRLRVTLCACEMLFPNCGPLPQTSHTCAIVLLQILWVYRTGRCQSRGNRFQRFALTPSRSSNAGRRTVFSRRASVQDTHFLRLAEYPV